jgi:hypothetical protein
MGRIGGSVCHGRGSGQPPAGYCAAASGHQRETECGELGEIRERVAAEITGAARDPAPGRDLKAESLGRNRSADPVRLAPRDRSACGTPMLLRRGTTPSCSEVKARQVDGLYVTGFSATRDFGPCFGFTAGSPAAAMVTVPGLLSRN